MDVIKINLIETDGRPEDISDDDLLAICAFTLESSIYKLMNAWGNMSKRSAEDMKYVAPYFKFLLEALRRLPQKYRYKGYGVRVLNATIPVMKAAWDNYRQHFAKGKSVNFHSMCSFGRDENLLQDFIDTGINNPVIILKCENVEGYLIEDISMVRNEGEVLVEGPSFFIVKRVPIKINNYVIVDIEFDERKSQIMSYLPNIQQIEQKENEQRKKRSNRN